MCVPIALGGIRIAIGDLEHLRGEVGARSELEDAPLLGPGRAFHVSDKQERCAHVLRKATQSVCVADSVANSSQHQLLVTCARGRWLTRVRAQGVAPRQTLRAAESRASCWQRPR